MANEHTPAAGNDFDGSYYAKHGLVYKRPLRRQKPEGGTAISLGFPVCKMHEAAGDDAAETVAALMNRGEAHDDLVKALEPFAEWANHIDATSSRPLTNTEYPPISGAPRMEMLRKACAALAKAKSQ